MKRATARQSTEASRALAARKRRKASTSRCEPISLRKRASSGWLTSRVKSMRRFESSWSEGAGMSLDDAVAYALADTSALNPAAKKP